MKQFKIRIQNCYYTLFSSFNNDFMYNKIKFVAIENG